MSVHFCDLDDEEQRLLVELVGHEGIFHDAPLAELLRVLAEYTERNAAMYQRLRKLHQRDDQDCRHCGQAYPCKTMRIIGG